MRVQFCDAMVRAGQERTNLVFLTGDLGFAALEPLQKVLGARFINAGVAEQNMVSVAAALASKGHEVWAYSIAPFIYARTFEQIRNDICLHRLPVRLVGNGGGFGYGVMGSTHHALEDYGILSTLPGLTSLVPAFDEDVPGIVDSALGATGPVYLRLGRGEIPAGTLSAPFEPWRQLLTGDCGVLVVNGPIVGPLLVHIGALTQSNRPSLWLASALPLSANPPPQALLGAIQQSLRLYVVEEHVATAGLGMQLSHFLMISGISPRVFRHFCAVHQPEGGYGSQQFMRERCGIDAPAVMAVIRKDLP